MSYATYWASAEENLSAKIALMFEKPLINLGDTRLKRNSHAPKKPKVPEIFE
jgi:hypothetical protein